MNADLVKLKLKDVENITLSLNSEEIVLKSSFPKSNFQLSNNIQNCKRLTLSRFAVNFIENKKFEKCEELTLKYVSSSGIKFNSLMSSTKLVQDVLKDDNKTFFGILQKFPKIKILKLKKCSLNLNYENSKEFLKNLSRVEIDFDTVLNYFMINPHYSTINFILQSIIDSFKNLNSGLHIDNILCEGKPIISKENFDEISRKLNVSSLKKTN
jgi:hypothetical protein